MQNHLQNHLQGLAEDSTPLAARYLSHQTLHASPTHDPVSGIANFNFLLMQLVEPKSVLPTVPVF
jgi:hypothetical protein